MEERNEAKEQNRIFTQNLILCEFSRLSSCNMLFMLHRLNANILVFVRASFVRNIYSLDEDKKCSNKSSLATNDDGGLVIMSNWNVRTNNGNNIVLAKIFLMVHK